MKEDFIAEYKFTTCMLNNLRTRLFHKTLMVNLNWRSYQLCGWRRQKKQVVHIEIIIAQLAKDTINYEGEI